LHAIRPTRAKAETLRPTNVLLVGDILKVQDVIADEITIAVVDSETLGPRADESSRNEAVYRDHSQLSAGN